MRCREILNLLIVAGALVISVISLCKSCAVDENVHQNMCIDELKLYPASVRGLEIDFIKKLSLYNGRRSANDYNLLNDSEALIVGKLNEYRASLDKYDCSESVYHRIDKMKNVIVKASADAKKKRILIQPVVNELKSIGTIDFKSACCD